VRDEFCEAFHSTERLFHVLALKLWAARRTAP
jgi:hypothetical protein